MMVWCCSQNLRDGIHACIRDYDRLQYVAVLLIYIQIGCALIGSLGALYNGVLLIDLGIALFALVAIESSSQSLGRTYAVLLFCAILLDISWFILFSHDIWNISSESESHGMLFIFSVRLTLAMEIIGFFVRLWSSLLWIQIYRLGVSYVDSGAGPRDPDFDLRNSFLNPATPSNSILRQCSHNDSDDVLGGAIYDPAYYSSLFEDRQQHNRNSFLGHNDAISGNESASGADASQLKFSPVRTLQAIDGYALLFFSFLSSVLNFLLE
ncbi:PREDICTED: uncharacterized protein LOC18589556 isoform X2 [Theobroma cacao]|uniref:Uncharacterized protein LOC18589556 isoform X2 n=1 Tax=Theobroma cacao TaxID=3641 RepID=A0AB32UQZ6_THECC|nr:PREDICTED: uncharacterized protein LOC18589556 isoform X2 [Theobroma cacao]